MIYMIKNDYTKDKNELFHLNTFYGIMDNMKWFTSGAKAR
jgi:hypothetical protein